MQCYCVQPNQSKHTTSVITLPMGGGGGPERLETPSVQPLFFAPPSWKQALLSIVIARLVKYYCMSVIFWNSRRESFLLENFIRRVPVGEFGTKKWPKNSPLVQICFCFFVPNISSCNYQKVAYFGVEKLGHSLNVGNERWVGASCVDPSCNWTKSPSYAEC